MSSDYLDMNSITEARRIALKETIRPITAEQMKTLGEGLFPSAEHPWREKFFQFINENSGETFHHATTDDQVHILYCASKNKGMWFVSGRGMGPLQATGLGIMKKIVEESH